MKISKINALINKINEKASVYYNLGKETFKLCKKYPSKYCNELEETCKYVHKNNKLLPDKKQTSLDQIKDFFEDTCEVDSSYEWCRLPC
jgi:hypothetical protein